MNKFLSILILFLVFTGCGMNKRKSQKTDTEREVVILAVNDIHANIDNSTIRIYG